MSELISGLGLIASACAVCVAAYTAYRQGKLTREIHTQQLKNTREIHEQQVKLSQRQMFIQIWPILSNLDNIDPQRLIEPSVVKTVNVLELVAVCCEGGMLDTDVIRRTFLDRFLEFYDVIKQVSKMTSTGKSGPDLLRENPAIGRLYTKLKEESEARAAIGGLGANAAQ